VSGDANPEEGRRHRRLSNKGPQLTAELTALRDPDSGMILVDVAHEWAIDHPDSALHGSLEWDNAVAGVAWRHQQIRHLITLHVVDAAGRPDVISLSIDRYHGGGYRSRSEVLDVPGLRAVALSDTLNELDRVLAKAEWASELGEVREALDRLKARMG
jgi:hypothetical protein